MCQCDCLTCRDDILWLQRAVRRLDERISNLIDNTSFTQIPKGVQAAAVEAPDIGVKHVDPFSIPNKES